MTVRFGAMGAVCPKLSNCGADSQVPALSIGFDSQHLPLLCGSSALGEFDGPSLSAASDGMIKPWMLYSLFQFNLV